MPAALYFQHLIKPRFLGQAPDARRLRRRLGFFKQFARVLDDHLHDRPYLLGERLSLADFAVAVTLPYAQEAEIPVADFPAIERWHDRLAELPAWRQPLPERTSAAA